MSIKIDPLDDLDDPSVTWGTVKLIIFKNIKDTRFNFQHPGRDTPLKQYMYPTLTYPRDNVLKRSEITDAE